jgi:hypothetical protein
MKIIESIKEKYRSYIEGRESFIEIKRAWNTREIPKEELEFDRDFEMIEKIPYKDKSDNLGIDNINMENMYTSEWFELRHQFGEQYMFLRFRFKKMNDRTLDRLKFVLKYLYNFELPSSEISMIKESYKFVELYVLKPVSFENKSQSVKIKYRNI